MSISEFKAALDAAGLSTKAAIIADGRLRRFYIKGDKKGSLNGWYVLHAEEIMAGAFGSWKHGINETWCAKSQNLMTPEERYKFSESIKKATQEREMEVEAYRQRAREKALYIWKVSPPAPAQHPYLVTKSVKSHGIKLYNNALVVPLRNVSGVIQSLQFINEDGSKNFLKGGLKKGCYFAIGTPQSRLCVCEGYSTAASIYEFTGDAVAVSFDAGNLLNVAKVMRSKFPEIELVICADDDSDNETNTGILKAREAAAAVGALVAYP